MLILDGNATPFRELIQEIYIYGCGGVGAEIAERFIVDKKYKLKGFIDDNPQIRECLFVHSKTLNEIVMEEKPETIKVIISVGEPVIRKKIAEKLKSVGIDEIIVDFSSHCNYSFTRVGKGCLLHEGTYISVNASIGRCCMINKGALVGHDCVIGDYSVISPNVTLGGNVSIGNGTFIGSGAIVRNGIHIGNNVIVGMGSVVVNDIEDNVVAVGNPAKVIRNNDKGRVFR